MRGSPKRKTRHPGVYQCGDQYVIRWTRQVHGVRKDLSAALPRGTTLEEAVAARGAKVGKCAPRDLRNGFVYFVEAAGAQGPMIKIGFASNMKRRLESLQIGCPDSLKVLLTVPANPDDERALHRRFRDDRVRGEWFRPSPAVTDFITSLRSTPAVSS